MDEERWDRLVRRLEGVARTSPRGYRARVAGLAALGYTYLFGVLLLIAALIAGIVIAALATAGIVVKFALPLLGLAFLILRAMWVRLPPPEGITLTKRNAPALFEELDELSRELKAPKVHHVLLDGDLNASIVQIPRLGVVGWQRNHLVVGLPLLQALSPEQFRAVLAHELGHLSGNHGRFSGWIYRVRRTWSQLLERLEQEEHWGAGIFRGFLRWYAPYFNAYSFALARADEYEADRAAADAAGREHAGEALVRLRLADWVLGTRYWPRVFERADTDPTPPRVAYAPMAHELASLPAGVDAAEVVRGELELETGTADTHPCLADRLSALGFSPGEFVERFMGGLTNGPQPSPTAASALLGTSEPELTQWLDDEWHQVVGRGWRERHEEACEARQTYDELAARDAAEPLGVDDLTAFADLTDRLHGPAEAVPVARRAVAADPDSAGARFMLGHLLLEAGDDEGLEHLERARQLDADAIGPASQIAFGYLAAAGRRDEAEPYRAAALERMELEERAGEERAKVTNDDFVDAHGLPDEAVHHVADQLSAYAGIKRAYLVRKVVDHLADERPLFILGIDRRRVGGRRAPSDIVQRLAAELDLPGEWFVVPLHRRYRKLRRRILETPGSEIHREP